MNYYAFFLAFFLVMISLWITERLGKSEVFYAKFTARVFAALTFLSIQYGIIAYICAPLSATLHGDWKVLIFLGMLISTPIASYLMFFLCNKFLGGFYVLDRTYIKKCAFAFYCVHLFGTFLTSIFSFFGLFLMLGGDPVYRRRNWLYGDSYYDRYY